MSMQLAGKDDANSLVPIVDNPNDDAMFNELATTGKWLPRIQLCGAASNEVKSGKIPMAHYGLIVNKDNVIDLDKEFDFLPLAWRPKAMDLGEEIISCFKPRTPEFERIVAQSDVPDSGCMYGPEFLVWLPSEKKFATLYLSNKTARRAAPALRDLIGKAATGKIEFIKTKKHSWHGPIFTKCSTPFELPSDDAVIEESERFLNPPDSDVEKAPEEQTGRKR